MEESAERDKIRRFGQNLSKIRKGKDLSLEMLANMADIDMSGLHRIETGKTNPKLSTIFALATALNINPKEFFE
jgi:transcriptional regulator with XRE-family HTH domain